MNMESMRVRSYRSIAADEHVPEEAAERHRTLKACGNLRAAGCSEEGALAPKSTRPRRVRRRAWKPRDVKAVMDVRRKYPFMGKARIHAMLARKGGHLSVSTVGRIIERALAAGAIRRASFCEGRVKPKRRRSFPKAPLARRWRRGGSTAPRPAGRANSCNAL